MSRDEVPDPQRYRLVDRELLDDIREFLEGQVDIDSNGGPNKAAQLLNRLDHGR